MEQEKQQPDSAVEYRIAQMCEKGLGSKVDIMEAVKWFRQAAENGHSYVQYKLSKLYLSGQGIQPDGQTANLYHKMVLKSFIKEDKEVPDAVRESIIAKMFLQGNSYALGFGSVPNYDTAIQWYEKSIQNGNSDAALELAKLFESGQGVKMDLNRAHQLYETALQGFEKRYERLGSDKANIDMQSVLAYKIGRMYLEGQGVPGNAVQALSWLKKSAALNNSVAQYQVGKMLLNGTGGIKDEQQAFEYFLQSAHGANKYAQYQVGKMYENGSGVTPDVDEAEKWYQASADNGNEAAQKHLEHLQNSEKFASAGAFGILIRLLAHNMGDQITDSTTRKFRQDKKLLHKQRQLKSALGHKDELEENM